MAGMPPFPLATFEQICESPADFLGVDVAALNLICASGLPGAETLDIGRCLITLDQWARYVRHFTDACSGQFADNPGDFENSHGYFCVLALVSALQRDLGVRYNPAKIRDASFQDPNCFDADVCDSRDLFIHGIIDGPGGTCATMPVVCVAVGRRLGYPLKLVESPGHLFARWNDPAGTFNRVPDRFNIECTGMGFGCHPDERYTKWPREWTQAEIDAGCYLKSLSPNEELAHWFVNRGNCLEDNGRFEEALRFYQAALALAPYDRRYLWCILHVQQKQRQLFQHLAEAEAVFEESQRRAQHIVHQFPQEHGPACGCWNCQQQRGATFDHGPSCRCAHCQKRHVVPAAGASGHPPSCHCPSCRGTGGLTPPQPHHEYLAPPWPVSQSFPNYHAMRPPLLPGHRPTE